MICEKRRKMKILHVITSLQTGGAEMLVVNLMPRFKALGHEVGVVVFNGQHTPLMERLERECPECKIYRLGTGYYNPWYIVKLIGIMRQYDVVHTHNSSPQLFAAIANIVCHKRLVTTEHNTNNRKRENWLYAQLDKWMYPRYEKIICISDQAEENLRGYLSLTPSLTPDPSPKGEGNENSKGRTKVLIDKLSVISYQLSDEDTDGLKNSKLGTDSKLYTLHSKLKNNITTIYNGVDVEAIHGATPLEELKTKRFVAVMVAGFRPQKDQDTLIKAMALLPKEEYELWLVGDGERRESLQLSVISYQLSDNIRFLGLRTDVPRILKSADVVVMSTHYEGLSLSNIEGMAAGKPFIASDVEGIHEVTEGYGILFPHEDAEALAAVIRRLHDDREYYDQVALRCYERARQYDIGTMVTQYNCVYHS